MTMQTPRSWRESMEMEETSMGESESRGNGSSKATTRLNHLEKHPRTIRNKTLVRIRKSNTKRSKS